MIQNKTKTQTHNNGIVKLYNVENIAAPGKKPIDGLTIKKALRYKERTVGINRFYAAMQANAQIVKVLRCPRLLDISTQDIAIPIDGNQYRIKQIQYPEDISPPVMDLSLERLEANYGFA